MVKSFESEHPNLSFVHVNQAASAGSDDFKRGYITNGLQRTDPMVVSAELLHKSLTAPAPPEPIVATAFWDLSDGDPKAITDASSKFKNGNNQACHLRSLNSVVNGQRMNNSMEVSTAVPTEVGNPTSGAGNQTSGAGDPASVTGNSASVTGNSASGASNPTSGAGKATSGAGNLTSGLDNSTSGTGNPVSGAGNLACGAGHLAAGAGNLTSGLDNSTSGTGNPVSGAGNLACGAGHPAAVAGRPSSGGSGLSATAGTASRHQVIVADNSGAAATVRCKQVLSLAVRSPLPNQDGSPPRSTSAKRPLVDRQSTEGQKTPRIVGPKFVLQPNQAECLKENRRLVSENTKLKEKNMELQEKLDLLGSILRDPRKRELLHARLQMHPAIKKN